jgi:hypothetical protein
VNIRAVLLVADGELLHGGWLSVNCHLVFEITL